MMKYLGVFFIAVLISVQARAQLRCEQIFIPTPAAHVGAIVLQTPHALSQDLKSFGERTYRSKNSGEQLLRIADLVLSVPIEKSVNLFTINRASINDENLAAVIGPRADSFIGLSADAPARILSGQLRHHDLNTEIVTALVRAPGNAWQSAEMPELLNQRIAEFNAQKNGANGDSARIITAIGLLVRDVQAMKPFVDSDRVADRLAHVLLMSLDLPPPRNMKIAGQLSGLNDQQIHDRFVQSMNATEALVRDFNERNFLGLSLSQSPWLHLSSPLPEISIRRKKQGSERSQGEKAYQPDANQWLAYVQTRVNTVPQLKIQAQMNPAEFLKEETEHYYDFVRDTTVEFDHEKEGVRDIYLRFADLDFIQHFNDRISWDPEAYKTFLNKWYRNEVIWRGHAFKDRVVSEDQIAAIFSRPDLQLASNPTIIFSWSPGSQWQNYGLREITRFNNSLLTGQVYEISDDHHRMGPLYQKSYGYSMSKSYDVGAAFAMGAMNGGVEYGKQMDAQNQIKTRLNIGTYRAKHFVEMGRLKPINSNFSYVYGRQQEVMGIGLGDPEAVEIIKELNPDKSPLKTYVRNPVHPTEILIISGDYDIGAPIPEDRILRKISLISDEDRARVQAGRISQSFAVNEAVQSPAQIAAPTTVQKIKAGFTNLMNKFRTAKAD